MTRKGKLKKILKHFSFSAETVPKLHIVILQPAKNPDLKDVILSVSEESHVFLFKSKNQEREPSDFVLRLIRKGKLARILEHPPIST